MKLYARAAALLLPVFLLVACGPEDSGPEPATGPLVVSATLVPSPLQVGASNGLRIEVKDSAGHPVTGATLTVTEWMPTMDHGAQGEPTIVEEGEGWYVASGVNFSMGGAWTVTVHASHEGLEGEVVVSCTVPDYTVTATLTGAATTGAGNQMRVEVRNGMGAPVSGATLTVTEWMPSMGHGAHGEPTVVEEGNGVYLVSGVNFSMPGDWTVTVRATLGHRQGEVVVSLHVP